MSDVYKKRKSCAICDNTEMLSILKYGSVPLAGYFPGEDQLEEEELFNLDVLFCSECYLVQTDSIINSDKLFKDYRYMSSIGLSGHFKKVAKLLKNRFNLDSNSRVIEIGSNDGVLLEPLMKLGIDATGFEPAVNISKIAIDKELDVINDYFNLEKAERYIDESSTDLIVSNNCFAHIEDIRSVVEGIKYSLKKSGYFVFEVSYLKDLIEKIQYDNIYHEHIYYYSLNALWKLFSSFGMTIIDYDFIPIHCGSIRVYVKNGKVESIPKKVTRLLMKEFDTGMTSSEWFKDFSDEVTNHIETVKNTIKELKQEGATIVGYGASGRANMLCNICDITKEQVDFIVDESPERAGRFIAGKQIPIVSPSALEDKDVDYIIIFAWNFADMIMSKLQDKGYKFLTFFPELKVITHEPELK